jgi:hypothetical protein
MMSLGTNNPLKVGTMENTLPIFKFIKYEYIINKQVIL